jgi:hypothetical protein
MKLFFLSALVVALSSASVAAFAAPASVNSQAKVTQRKAVIFRDISRKTGGEWVRVQLAEPTFLDYLEIMVFENGLDVSKVYLITESGRRVALNEFDGRIVDGPSMITSDYIRVGEKVTAIDIRAEALGDAYVAFTLVSTSAYPEATGLRP